MGRTLGELAVDLHQLGGFLARDVEEQAWESALARARDCARVAGQLLQRLNAMQDVFAEARARAEVDRSLKRVQ